MDVVGVYRLLALYVLLYGGVGDAVYFVGVCRVFDVVVVHLDSDQAYIYMCVETNEYKRSRCFY